MSFQNAEEAEEAVGEVGKGTKRVGREGQGDADCGIRLLALAGRSLRQGNRVDQLVCFFSRIV